MGDFLKVAERSEVPDGGAKCVEARGISIALFNTGGAFHALANTCTHKGGPLCEGTVEDGEVECPWHGARFKLASGEVTSPPAMENVQHYNVRLSGEDIEIEL